MHQLGSAAFLGMRNMAHSLDEAKRNGLASLALANRCAVSRFPCGAAISLRSLKRDHWWSNGIDAVNALVEEYSPAKPHHAPLQSFINLLKWFHNYGDEEKEYAGSASR